MKKRGIVLCSLVLLVATPLAARWPFGLPDGFMDFPPVVTTYPDHAPFSWIAFAFFGVLGLLSAVILSRPHWFGFKRPGGDAQPPTRARPDLSLSKGFPWWGWLGLAMNVAAWICAWLHVEWLGPLKDHTFVPIWVGYILIVDGLVVRRSGTSIASRSPGTFFLLFPVSALSWWYFEFVNRFVKNWWYEGTELFTPMHYIVFASLSFSTVLPAVFETADWLLTHQWFQERYRRGPKWKRVPRSGVIGFGVAGIVTLALMANFVDPLFFLTWLAPLAILAGALTLSGVETPFHDWTRGDYTRAFTLAIAALICGWFWEMWNFFSLPKWNYSVPYVNVLKVFEMPLLGFSGYLPFGPICWCMWLAVVALLPDRMRSALGLKPSQWAVRD